MASKALAAYGCPTVMHVVRLLAPQLENDNHTKDVDFSPSGIYLACYFSGGLTGSAVLGQMFDRFGWTPCVCGIGLSLVAAATLTVRLKLADV